MSSKKRVSVFARLGPAGPISPEESVPSHRRYSTDKHLEKGHHSLPPLPHPAHSHTHTTGREDTLRERERERKPSHQDYDDKKQLHYREPPPQPLPSSSRHRSHKHYHDDPEYLDDSKPMGRSEKRSSLPTPLAPPPPSWKSRDLADRLSPTGKDILSKPFMGHEDKLSKMSRGSVSSEGGGGGGGGGRVGGGVGKTKRTTPPEKRSSPPQEGATESEGEAGEGEEGRRKRPRTEKRAKPEGGVEDSRRASKTYQSEREREQRERGGKEKTERDRHAWPEKPLLSSLVPASEGGTGDTKEPRARPERGRPEEREGRRKRDDEWPEPRELGRKRKRDYSEGDCTPPPPESSKRIRTADYQAAGSKEHTDSRPHSAEVNTLSRDEKHSRLPKEAESVDRKRRFEGSLDSNKELPPPKKPRSGESSSSRKYSRTDPSSSSSSSTSVRKKTERQHKEKTEQEHGGESGGEGAAKAPPKLDWSTISALCLPKPKPPSTSAVQRFSPGAIFSRLGVSRSLAGPDLYREISSAVAKQLKKDQEALVAETGNSLPDDVLEDPFGKSEFAMTGVSWIRNAKENCQVCTNIGPCRRALVASVDFALRRKMGKSNKDLLPPSPSSGSWSSQQFASASLLYNSLGTKSSGKPAFRLEPSEVGSLLIPK